MKECAHCGWVVGTSPASQAATSPPPKAKQIKRTPGDPETAPCPKCGSLMLAGEEMCIHCRRDAEKSAAALATRECEQCHNQIFVTAKKCHYCGWVVGTAPTTLTPEQRIEAELADGNHIKDEPGEVAERFWMLRVIAGLWILLGLAPWACVFGLFVAAGQLGLSAGSTFPLVFGALVAVAVFTTVAGLAISEMLRLAVSVEHQLRLIAERLDKG